MDAIVIVMVVQLIICRSNCCLIKWLGVASKNIDLWANPRDINGHAVSAHYVVYYMQYDIYFDVDIPSYVIDVDIC